MESLPAVEPSTALIVALVPVLLGAWKKYLPAPPKWTLPLIAGALGVVLDSLDAVRLNVALDPATGVALGWAGIGVRETIDQLRKLMGGGAP